MRPVGIFKQPIAPVAPLNPPPDITLFLADDLGWSDLAVYGNAPLQSPHINALAANGLALDNTFLTTSSCSASRASILTVKYPHSNGLVHLHQPLPRDQTTLVQLLRAGGYHTEAVAKWHLDSHAVDHFSKVIAEPSNSSGAKNWVHRLQQRPQDKPSFFWPASYDPHRPHQIDDAGIKTAYDVDAITVPAGCADGPGTRHEMVDYYSEITRFEQNVGLVTKELEAQGVLDNTLVIVMSDNRRPFYLAKETLYDDGIKIPFIVHWPITARTLTPWKDTATLAPKH